MPAQSRFGAHTILAFTEATLSRMPVLKVIKKIKTPSFARLSPLATCRIIGLREAGAERDDIRKQVKKKDRSILLDAVPCIGYVARPIRRSDRSHRALRSLMPVMLNCSVRFCNPPPRCHNHVTSRSQPGHIQVTSRSHPGHENNETN